MTVAFAPKKSKFEGPSKEPAEPNKGMEPHESGDNTDGDEQDISHMDIHEAVATHGPAHKIHIEHSEGSHHVHSEHGAMHHHSEHPTHEAAHEHAKMAAGMSHEEEERREEKVSPGIHEKIKHVPGYEG